VVRVCLIGIVTRKGKCDRKGDRKSMENFAGMLVSDPKEEEQDLTDQKGPGGLSSVWSEIVSLQGRGRGLAEAWGGGGGGDNTLARYPDSRGLGRKCCEGSP
jgi:hypothetical protein